MLALLVLSRSLRSNNDNSLSVPRVKTNRAFHSCLFGTTSRCLSIQPIQLMPLRDIWRHIPWTWPFPNRYRHAPWPIDVTEWFPQFCCWTTIRLLRHWDWLSWGYWCYRSLIDMYVQIFTSCKSVQATLNCTVRQSLKFRFIKYMHDSCTLVKWWDQTPHSWDIEVPQYVGLPLGRRLLLVDW